MSILYRAAFAAAKAGYKVAGVGKIVTRALGKIVRAVRSVAVDPVAAGLRDASRVFGKKTRAIPFRRHA